MIEKQIQFSRTLGVFLNWMAEQDYHWIMGDVWRSTDKLPCPHCGREHSYQEVLVYNKKSKQVKSKHCDRLAADLILIKDGKPIWEGEAYRPLGEKWESLGGRWGGRFGITPDKYATSIGWDAGHYEL